jgi:hypothetical protein
MLTRKIAHARSKTEKVQEDLQVASAELGLAHGALERQLPPQAKTGDVAWAIGQNAAVEQKVQQAAQDLQEVKDILHREEAEIERLELELSRRGGRVT